MRIVPVKFIGGPFDGLAQGWKTENPLPDTLRMSIELGTSRGGMRLEVADPSTAGALLPQEKASDETVYRKRDKGVYFHEPLSEDFEVVPIGSA